MRFSIPVIVLAVLCGLVPGQTPQWTEAKVKAELEAHTGVAASSLGDVEFAQVNFSALGVILTRAKAVELSTGRVVGATWDENGLARDYGQMRAADIAARRADPVAKIDERLRGMMSTSVDEPIEVIAWLDCDMDAIDRFAADAIRGLGANTPRSVGRATERRIDAFVSGQVRDATGPFVAVLNAMGITPRYVSVGAPLVCFDATASQILDLAALPNVDTVYPELDEQRDTNNDSRQSHGTDHVQGMGINGSGVEVALMEDNGVDPNCPHLNIAAWYRIPADPDDHIHGTTGNVGSTLSSRLGSSTAASLYSANAVSYSDSNLIAAADWALAGLASGTGGGTSPTVEILNGSFGPTTGTTGVSLDALDRYFDFRVRAGQDNVVLAGGNSGTANSVGHASWNSIAVGAFDNNGTEDWGDDNMATFSAAVNPATGCEKPNVAASGVGISTIGDANGTGGGGAWLANGYQGTSFAAPFTTANLANTMVTGVGGCNVSCWPSAGMAVMMATAWNNIEGSSRLSGQDGAGGIDGLAAVRAAQNGQIHNVTATPASFTSGASSCGGTYYVHEITLQAGIKTRVALAWHSYAANSTSTPTLRADLDLAVYSGSNCSGSALGFSSSINNNFEIVEFTPATTGTYSLRVNDYTFTGSSEWMSLAWSQETDSAPAFSLSLPGFTPMPTDGYGSIVPFDFTVDTGRWNAVGVASASDWDITVGSGSAASGGSATDFVIANGHNGAITPLDGMATRFSGTNPARVMRSYNVTLNVGTPYTIAGWPANRVVRMFEFNIPSTGSYDITLSNAPNLAWRLHEPGSNAAWRNDSNFVSSGTAGGATVTRTFNQTGWHAISVFHPTSDPASQPTFSVSVEPAIIPNPIPSIGTLSPSTIAAGSSGFTLDVNGSNFLASSVIRWDGASQSTTYVSPTLLRCSIPASFVATTGSHNVQVFNPAPGGGTSSSSTFTVTAPLNPAPTVTGANPASVAVHSGPFTLTVNGSDFMSSSVIRFAGTPLATTFVSANALTATVPGALVCSFGSVVVEVVNPTPGGGVGSTNFNITSATTTPVVASATLPSGYLTTDGNGATSFPQNTTTDHKWQWHYDSGEFQATGPITITEVWVRASTATATVAAFDFPSFVVTMASSSTDYSVAGNGLQSGHDPVFANNLNSDATVVKTGAWSGASVPASGGATATWIPLGLTGSFTYNPALGSDFVIQIEKCGTNANWATSMDGASGTAGLNGGNRYGHTSDCAATSSTFSNNEFVPIVKIDYTSSGAGTPQTYSVNSPEASFSIDCISSNPFAPGVVSVSQFSTVAVLAESSLVGLPWELAYTLSPTVPAGGGATVFAPGEILNLGLFDPTLSFLNNSFATPWVGVPIALEPGFPVGTYGGQFCMVNPGAASGFTFSGAVDLTVIGCNAGSGFEGPLLLPSGWSTPLGTNSWTVHANGTSSFNTGPTSASSGANYLYCETSGTQNWGATFAVDTPSFAFGSLSNLRLDFELSRIGAAIGSLDILLDDGSGTFATTIGSYTGADPSQSQGGIEWSSESIDLAPYATATGTGIIRFQYLSGSTFTGDIALDDICIN